jgi:hypothetical protein
MFLSAMANKRLILHAVNTGAGKELRRRLRRTKGFRNGSVKFAAGYRGLLTSDFGLQFCRAAAEMFSCRAYRERQRRLLEEISS